MFIDFEFELHIDCLLYVTFKLHLWPRYILQLEEVKHSQDIVQSSSKETIDSEALKRGSESAINELTHCSVK